MHRSMIKHISRDDSQASACQWLKFCRIAGECSHGVAVGESVLEEPATDTTCGTEKGDSHVKG